MAIMAGTAHIIKKKGIFLSSQLRTMGIRGRGSLCSVGTTPQFQSLVLACFHLKSSILSEEF
jgi:hypothetical protein